MDNIQDRTGRAMADSGGTDASQLARHTQFANELQAVDASDPDQWRSNVTRSSRKSKQSVSMCAGRVLVDC